MTYNENNYLLCEAAAEGNVEEVARLVQLCDARWCENAALREAACGNYPLCVELLILHSTAHDNDSWALRDAAEKGHHECVKLLIDVSDPDDFPIVLENATRAGCSKSVALVLQYVSNIRIVTAALEIAVMNSHYDCVDVLYPGANVVAALENLTSYYPHCQKFWQPLQDRYNAEQQKIALNSAVESTHIPTPRSSKM